MKATDPIFREKVLKLEGTVIKFSSFIFVLGIIFRFFNLPGASILMTYSSLALVMTGLMVMMSFQKWCTQRLFSLTLGLVFFSLLFKFQFFPCKGIVYTATIFSSIAYLYLAMKEHALGAMRSTVIIVLTIAFVIIAKLP